LATILFVFSTVDGHTREICERLAAQVQHAGHTASLGELRADTEPDLAGSDRVVIGASIRYGRHRPEVARFMKRHREALESRHAVFFSVNVVARKPNRRDAHTNPYVRKFLRSLGWQPAEIAIFAGKIDYPRYGFFDRTMIRLIMYVTGGPTDPTSTTDFTDWDAVDALAGRIATID